LCLEIDLGENNRRKHLKTYHLRELTVRLASVLVAVALYMIASVYYVWRAWLPKGDPRQTKPVLATWILMLTVFTLATWMYWHSPSHSLAGNIGTTVGFANILVIFVGVLFVRLRDGDKLFAFNPFQKKCLAAGAVIVVFWCVTGDGERAYYLTQGLAFVGYLATVERLFKAQRNTEPLLFWVLLFLACLASVYPAVFMHDKLAKVYLWRSVPSTAIVIVLILRLKRREQLSLRGDR
jgi:amino acid transporter